MFVFFLALSWLVQAEGYCGAARCLLVQGKKDWSKTLLDELYCLDMGGNSVMSTAISMQQCDVTSMRQWFTFDGEHIVWAGIGPGACLTCHPASGLATGDKNNEACEVTGDATIWSMYPVSIPGSDDWFTLNCQANKDTDKTCWTVPDDTSTGPSFKKCSQGEAPPGFHPAGSSDPSSEQAFAFYTLQYECHDYADGAPSNDDECKSAGFPFFFSGGRDDYPGCGTCWCCKYKNLEYAGAATTPKTMVVV